MVIEDIQVIIKNNIDDQTVNVDEAIDMAIKFLSNFFPVRKIEFGDNTVSTGDVSIVKPARCSKVLKVKIGDDYIKKADLDKMQEIEDDESQRYFVEDDFIAAADNKIHLAKAISADQNGDKIYIWYLAGFKPLAGVAVSTTDLPERLEPLLISFATYFYYGILVSYIKNNKAAFPNMTIWDVVAIWDTWRIHSFNLLKIVQKQHFNLSD